MRLLLDSHVLVWIGCGERARLPAKALTLLEADSVESFMSAASFWELAIKQRLGKLELSVSVADLAAVLQAALTHLPVTHHHATALLDVEPLHKDPFDRLLLAQCQVEGLRLLTLDAALAAHPLVLKY